MTEKVTRMIFERANINDIPALTAMRLAYIKEDSGELPDGRMSEIAGNLPGYFEKHLEKEVFAFVCRVEDHRAGLTVAGCCMLYISEKPPGASFPTGKTGTVLNVYTLPDFRKKGIARRLMEDLMSFARKCGLDYVELKATEMGWPLYKSLGFEDYISCYHEMKLYCK